MPKRGANAGRVFKRDKDGQFAKTNTLSGAKKAAPKAKPARVTDGGANRKRRVASQKLLRASVMQRKNEEFAQKVPTTPKVAVEVEKAKKRAVDRKGEATALRKEIASLKPAAPAAKPKMARKAPKTRSANTPPSVTANVGHALPAHLPKGTRVTSKKDRNPLEVVGTTRHPDVVRVRDTKANVTFDRMVSEIAPQPKPQGRRAKRQAELDAIVSNSANYPSQAAYSADYNAAKRRLDPVGTARVRKAAKKANQMEIPNFPAGFPTSGTWESPRGSLLTQVEKVDKRLLAAMYKAEDTKQPIPRADSKTENAFQLGYGNPRIVAAQKLGKPSPVTFDKPTAGQRRKADEGIAAMRAARSKGAKIKVQRTMGNRDGQPITVSEPFRMGAKHYSASPQERTTMEERERREGFLQIPGSKSAFGSYAVGSASPVGAGKVKTGDIIGINSTRQSSYMSPSMNIHNVSKAYEVANVGEDERGLFVNVRKPGGTGKGGQVRWRPENFDMSKHAPKAAPVKPAEKKSAAQVAGTPTNDYYAQKKAIFGHLQTGQEYMFGSQKVKYIGSTSDNSRALIAGGPGLPPVKVDVTALKPISSSKGPKVKPGVNGRSFEGMSDAEISNIASAGVHVDSSTGSRKVLNKTQMRAVYTEQRKRGSAAGVAPSNRPSSNIQPPNDAKAKAAALDLVRPSSLVGEGIETPNKRKRRPSSFFGPTPKSVTDMNKPTGKLPRRSRVQGTTVRSAGPIRLK